MLSATYRRRTDATCSKSLRTKHHQQVCSSIQDPIEYGLHVINNILSPTMVLKSENPTVITLNPHSAIARRGSVFAGVLVEIGTFDALFLLSVELIQISVDSLQS